MVAGVRVPAAGARRGGRRRHPGHRRPGDQRSIDRRPGRPPADGPGSDHCSGGGRCFDKERGDPARAEPALPASPALNLVPDRRSRRVRGALPRTSCRRAPSAAEDRRARTAALRSRGRLAGARRAPSATGGRKESGVGARIGVPVSTSGLSLFGHRDSAEAPRRDGSIQNRTRIGAQHVRFTILGGNRMSSRDRLAALALTTVLITGSAGAASATASDTGWESAIPHSAGPGDGDDTGWD